MAHFNNLYNKSITSKWQGETPYQQIHDTQLHNALALCKITTALGQIPLA